MLLDVYKVGREGSELVETIELSASKRVYRVGRQQGVSDIMLTHGSISREQATLTVSASGSVVVADLGSAHGTRLSGKRLEPHRPHLLPVGRSMVFGQSTRVFKLREGGSGYISAAGGAAGDAAAAMAPGAADDPRVSLAIDALRGCGSGVPRPRPDGFVPLPALAGCEALSRAGCTELVLASLAAAVEGEVEARDEAGVLLLRATGGHATHLRVDPSLSLEPPAQPLPATLVFGLSFREWNSVRSKGIGAGCEPPRPIRLCAAPPRRGAKLASLGGRAADLLGTPDGQGHGQTTTDQNYGIEGTQWDVKETTCCSEGVDIEVTIYTITSEESTKKENFLGNKCPHPQSGRFILLFGRFEVMLTAYCLSGVRQLLSP